MSDVLDRLNERLDLSYDAPREPQEGWSVRDMDSASWAARKCAEADAQISAIDAWEAREIDKIRAAAATERGRYESTREFFMNSLGAYLQSLIHEGRKVKSLATPHGVVRLRARPVQFEIDEDAALAWAKDTHPGLLKYTVKLDKAGFKKALALGDDGALVDPESGEVLPFARWVDPGESISFTAEAGDE
jgi:hypothetical protein